MLFPEQVSHVGRLHGEFEFNTTWLFFSIFILDFPTSFVFIFLYVSDTGHQTKLASARGPSTKRKGSTMSLFFSECIFLIQESGDIL